MQKDFVGYIYRIDSLLPELSGCYIGQTTRTVNQRWRQHINNGKHGKIHFDDVMHFYGVDNFKCTQIAVAHSKDELDRLERLYIEQYDSIRHGFNRNKGGSGSPPTEAARINMQLTCYKNKPVIHHETGTQYISGTAAARALGLHSSDVTQCCRMKLAQVLGNHFRYPDTPVELYMEYWKASSRRNRKVLCINTGVIYESASECIRLLGISRDGLYKQLSNPERKLRNSDLKFRWADL